MLRVLVRLSAVLLTAYLLGGCMTGLHQVARTTPEGGSEMGGIVTLACYPQGTPGSVKGTWLPFFEMYSRRGLSENSDWGVCAGVGLCLAGSIDYKYRLVSGAVDVAGLIGGSVYVAPLPFGLGGIGVLSLSPRVVASRESGLPWALNAGLDYYPLIGSAAGRANLRAGIGLPLNVFKSWRIMPEMSYSQPLYSTDMPGVPIFGVSLGRIESEEAAVEGLGEP